MPTKMSNDISSEINGIAFTDGVIFPSMPTKVESLQDYVRRILRDKVLSFNDVSRLSRGRISAGYVSDIVQGNAKNVTVEKLQALALGLGVSEEEVFAVARGINISRDAVIEGRLAALFHRAKVLKSEEDQQWFLETMQMVDAELERRRRKTRDAHKK